MSCECHACDARSEPYRFPPHCVKFPPVYGIELLIDDSEAVAADGRRLGFRVLRVDPTDADWAERVLAIVRRRS